MKTGFASRIGIAKTQEIGLKKTYVPPKPRLDHYKRLHEAAENDWTRDALANAQVLDQRAKAFAASRHRPKDNDYVHVEGLDQGLSSFSGPMLE